MKSKREAQKASSCFYSQLGKIIIVLSFIVFMLSACTPSAPPSDAPKAPPQLPPPQDKFPSNPAETHQDIPVNMNLPPESPPPKPTLKDMLKDAQAAQQKGDSGNMDAINKAGRQAVRDASEKIDATITELLDALALAQQLGIDDKSITDAIINRIRGKLEGELSTLGLCKKRLIEIAAIAQGLGFDDLNTKAMKRAETAPVKCASITYIYETHEPSNGDTQKTEATATGTLKKYAPLGQSGSEGTSYTFTDGELTWTFDETLHVPCETITTTGSGTASLTQNQGSLEVLARDNSYESPVISVRVNVNEAHHKLPINPEYPSECNEFHEHTDVVDHDIQVYLKGTVSDTKHITGQIADSWTPDNTGNDFTGHSETTWDLVVSG